ncbi:serine/threonine/tyrosine-interacting-like protein 1 [Sycon ciliatum]|uniref:serine/threonine/tyrosine-interacting-like protein 1 n=1 Tax=Sycon ciliatum TaxID=27933 RepID=UPI0031F69710|eukprot:scpid94421/ scgid34091/ Serine/threonine/tyrosine-interacting-like protein 1; Dual specificity phosphatase inhibitor MK-STYX; Dual specificity protein phosphatase 24; Map kinase phosphatase-like protein MK-STYX
MASEIRLMEPRLLYNLMNRVQGAERRPVYMQHNFLVILDARDSSAKYEKHHIRGAIKPKNGIEVPQTINVASIRYCVVYDSESTTILPNTDAYALAEELAKVRGDPVYILKGGIARFSREYLYLGSESRVLYTPRELEGLQMWPLDMYDYLLFAGLYDDQWSNAGLASDMSLRAVLLLEEEDSKATAMEFTGASKENVLKVKIPSNETTSLLGKMQSVVEFIDSYVKQNLRVLLLARRGVGMIDMAVFVMAFLISKDYRLKDAHEHVVSSCDPVLRPGRQALEDLAAFARQVPNHPERDTAAESGAELVLPL